VIPTVAHLSGGFLCLLAKSCENPTRRVGHRTYWKVFAHDDWGAGTASSSQSFSVSFCCLGRVGDANGVGTYPQEVTISDIQLLVTAKFIQGTCIGIVPCLAEGDANQSGGANPTCNDITISDIQTLVNHLFIAGPANAPLKNCL